MEFCFADFLGPGGVLFCFVFFKGKSLLGFKRGGLNMFFSLLYSRVEQKLESTDCLQMIVFGKDAVSRSQLRFLKAPFQAPLQRNSYGRQCHVSYFERKPWQTHRKTIGNP